MTNAYVEADTLDRLLLRAMFRSDDARAWVRTVGIGGDILDDAALVPVFEWLIGEGAGDPGRMPESVRTVVERGDAASLGRYITDTEVRPEWAMRDLHRVVRARSMKWLPMFLHEAADFVDKHTEDGRAGPVIEHVARVFLFLDMPAERTSRDIE